MSYSKVNLISWNRFITRRFAVEPELFGLVCEFPFQKAQVRIELPSKDNLDNNSEDSNIALISWKEENGRKIPLQVAVSSVDVLVNLNKSILIPEKVLTRLTCPQKTVPDIMLGIDKKGAIDGKERLHTGADY